jgi:hypothetical protein
VGGVKLKLKLTQPAKAGAWAELGNYCLLAHIFEL